MRQEMLNKIHGKLHCTEQEISVWENKDYSMDKEIAERFWNIVAKYSTVCIVGDYDCDGITSTYIMREGIKTINPETRVFMRIPRRFSEGYGLSVKIAEAICRKVPKGSLIITVDNGIAAKNAVDYLNEHGMDVIVTDHHELGNNEIPNALMVLDPKVEGCCEAFAGDYYCGAGVSYKIVEYIVDSPLKLRELSVYAGLATVADCMPLKEENFLLVRNAINNTRSLTAPAALEQLVRKMGCDPAYCVEETFSFYVAPAFNAPGRLIDDGASLVVKYLMDNTQDGAFDKLNQIVEYNKTRKQLRDEYLELAKTAAFEQGQIGRCPMWVYVPNMPEGIVGIVAGKLVEEYQVPAIVLTDSQTEGIVKGSARSIKEGDFDKDIDILNYLLRCGDIYTSIGGHKGAAGLSLPYENLRIGRKNQLDRPRKKENEPIRIEVSDINDIATELKKFRPFGEGNPEPEFELMIDPQAVKIKRMGDGSHLLIQGDNWKVTHFYHYSAEEDVEQFPFLLQGKINFTGFRDTETATFNAKKK